MTDRSDLNVRLALARRLRHSRHSLVTAVTPEYARANAVPEDERALYSVQMTMRDLDIILRALEE